LLDRVFPAKKRWGYFRGYLSASKLHTPTADPPMSQLAAALRSRVCSPSAQRMRVLLFSLRGSLDFADLQAVSGVDPLPPIVNGCFGCSQNGKLSQKRALALAHDRGFNRLRDAPTNSVTRPISFLWESLISINCEKDLRTFMHSDWLEPHRSISGGR